MILGVRHLSRLVLVFTLLGLLIPTLGVSSVAAATPVTYTVGLTGDDNGSFTATCAIPTNTACRLRDAIAASNANDPGTGQNTIRFKAGLASPIVLTAPNPTLTLSKNVSIVGPGATVLAVDGGCTGCDPGGTPAGGVAVFTIGPITASIAGLTIQHGHTAGLGGAINITGAAAIVTVSDAVLSSNVAGNGAVVSVPSTAGVVTVRNTTISGNTMTGVGGALINFGPATIVTGSTFAGNKAPINGGGINNQPGGVINVSNSTFTNNTSGGFGGALTNLGTMSLTNVTVSGNKGSTGGGIATGNPNVTLTNTIFANNTNTTNTLDELNPAAGTFAGTNNLIDDAATAGTFTNGTNGNIVGLPAQLGPFGSYRGTTQTFSLLPASPALDAGAAVGAGPSGNPVPAIDQRGITRPQGGGVDIGAYESDGFVLTVNEGTTPQSIPIGGSPSVHLSVTVKDTLGNPLPTGIVTFTAPGTGASGTFAGGVNTATSNASGIANALTFTANNVQGSYQVTATMNAATPTTFTLTNTAVPLPQGIPGAPPSGGVPGTSSRPSDAPPGPVVPPPTGR